MPTTASERSLKDLRAAKMHTAADLVCAFPEEHWRRVRTTDEIDNPFLLDLLFWRSTGDRVAKSRPEDVSPTAQPSTSLLIGGTRAPFFRTTRLPSADEGFVGMFSVTRDIDLPIA